MTHSALTNQIKLSYQNESRQGATVDTFLIHHQAGLNDDATIEAMVSGSKEVSANYTISTEGRLSLIVDEDRRAFTSGSRSDGGKGRAWDMRAITVEIENQTAAPDWKISVAALNTAAALLKDLRKRYPMAHVLGHRDLFALYGASYPTYCPGPNTVAEIISRASGATVIAPVSAPAVVNTPGSSWAFNLPDAGTQRAVQAALKQRGRYSGPVDGAIGPNGIKGVQLSLRGVGYGGPIDGVPGRETCTHLQAYARKFGDYLGPVDGVLGGRSWAGFLLGLQRP